MISFLFFFFLLILPVQSSHSFCSNFVKIEAKMQFNSTLWISPYRICHERVSSCVGHNGTVMSQASASSKWPGQVSTTDFIFCVVDFDAFIGASPCPVFHNKWNIFCTVDFKIPWQFSTLKIHIRKKIHTIYSTVQTPIRGGICMDFSM